MFSLSRVKRALQIVIVTWWRNCSFFAFFVTFDSVLHTLGSLSAHFRVFGGVHWASCSGYVITAESCWTDSAFVTKSGRAGTTHKIFSWTSEKLVWWEFFTFEFQRWLQLSFLLKLRLRINLRKFVRIFLFSYRFLFKYFSNDFWVKSCDYCWI